MRDCQRCNKEWGQDVVIAGGVCAKLCSPCRTDLHEFIQNQTAWLDLLLARGRLIQATNADCNEVTGSEGRMRSLILTENQAENALFEIMKRWLAETSTEPEARAGSSST
jgi:hypothetical protein